MTRWLVGAVVGLATLFVVPAAAAQLPTATFEERAGDAPTPQLDVTAAAVSYDRANGVVAGSYTLGAAPTGAEVNSVNVEMGRFRLDGSCLAKYDAVTWIPDAADIGAGLTSPYTELFPATSTKALGFLATQTNGSTINFDATEANSAVADALKSGRFTCATIETMQPGTFDIGDESDAVPFVSGPRPRCRFVRRSVRAGRSFPVRCKHAGKRVTVRLIKGRDIYTGKERVRGGRFRVPTTRTMRGRWIITIWKGDIVIGSASRARVR